MPLDRVLLIFATLSFLGGFAYAAFSIGAGRYSSRKFNMTIMAVGFALQSGFLYLRGQQHGRCPITNVFEILIFVSWAMVLLYFVVGPTYRLSLLGVFTAPLAFLFHLTALLLPASQAAATARPAGPVDFWLEIHASVSLLAYGAFALAGVAGVMYLVQDRHLKRHDLSSLFYNLPPIRYLGKAIVRLLALGFGLLTVGIASAYGMDETPDSLKLGASYAVWAVYGLLLLVHCLRGLPATRVALAAVVVFAAPVVTLWIVTP